MKEMTSEELLSFNGKDGNRFTYPFKERSMMCPKALSGPKVFI